MLLFVTTNKASAITDAAGRLDARGHRARPTSTPRPPLYSKVADADDAGTNAAVTFSRQHEVVADPARLRRHRGRPGGGLRLCGRDPEPLHAHHSRSQRGDRRLVRRLLLGRQGRAPTAPSGPCPPARPSAAPSPASAPAGSPRSHPTPTRRSPWAPAPVAPRPAASPAPRRRCGPIVLQADPDSSPNVAPGGVVHRGLRGGDLHVQRLGVQRHVARHHRVLRLGLRRRNHRHRRVPDAHLHQQWGEDGHPHRDRQRRTALGARDRALPTRPTRRPPAGDNITFRAAAQAAANQTTARVTIPASVRETDGMLLFVTSNKALRHRHDATRRLDARGHPALEHRHRDHPLQQGRGGQRRRPQRGRRLHGDHQGHA